MEQLQQEYAKLASSLGQVTYQLQLLKDQKTQLLAMIKEIQVKADAKVKEAAAEVPDVNT